jgi:hypothetical protein
MKTNSLISDEKLTASRTSPLVFTQHILLLVRTNQMLSSEAGIFSRDGPFSLSK